MRLKKISVLKSTRNLTVILFAAQGLIFEASAQNIAPKALEDTTDAYYVNYEFDIIPRLYIADKVHNLKVNSSDGKNYFHYRPNANFRLGFGATYRAITLNLDFGIGGKNLDKGKTSSLDLQSNIYTKDWAIDLLLQSYKGYYISNPGFIIDNGPYYTNPDMRMTVIGGGAWRILNNEEFSYQAAMTQSEWQLKSAGSVLIGAETYYGKVNAHGPLVPAMIKDSFPQRNVERLRFFKIGPGVGYAYTYVYEKNYFASAGLSTVFEAGFVKESTTDGSVNKFSVQPDVTFRMGVGYNSRKWTASLAVVTNTMPIRGGLSSEDYSFHSGNLKLTLARRFIPNSRTKKMLKRVDEQLDRLD